MDAIKEILLQILISCLPAFLFPLTYERFRSHSHDDAHSSQKAAPIQGLSVFCGISMLLCSFFSGHLGGVIPLNFGILPLFALILYGSLREGLILAIIKIVIFPVFVTNHSIYTFIFGTGLMLFPFVFWSSSHFKKVGRHGKVMILSLFFVIGEFMITASPVITGRMAFQSDIVILFAAILNIGITVLVGSLFIHMIESTLEKEKLRQQVIQLSRRYFREAEKLQQMMDAAPLSIILLDKKGYIVSVNDTFLQLYRSDHPVATREDLIRQKLNSALIGCGFEVMISRVEETLEGNVKSSELLQSRDGNKVYFTSTSPIKKGITDETIGAVIIVQDITELETLRMELNHVERLSLVGQMAAGITHEIRNPMAVVRGFLQLMREKSPSNMDNYYRIVMEELDRANSIINDFLALAQNRVVEKELCSLHAILQELSPLLWADANLRGQSIEVQLGEGIPHLLLNAKEIKQLILNLSRNGMEAMEGKGQLTLETTMTEGGVLLHVKDTGPGIPAGKLEKLFEPFYTTKNKGTGLGLALCLSIMERHGGKITVKSDEGAGTTFIVYFPTVGEIRNVQ